MFRYADDWIVVIRGTKSQAQVIKEEFKQFLQDEMGLELSEEKTSITHVSDGFDCLGYHIFRNDKPTDGKAVGVFVQPTAKGLKRMKQKMQQITTRKTLNDDDVRKLEAINAAIRGWANYYRAVNPIMAFQELDRYVWSRLWKWLGGKDQIGPKQVRRQYMYRQAGPKGGTVEFAAQEADGTWVWRYRTVQTKLIYYRPSFKRHWPNPLLEKVQSEHYVLPTLKTLWGGYTEAPTYEAHRREVLKRAGGNCERCGTATKLTVHHKHRAKRGKRPLEQADHRPEMMEALGGQCHAKEHKAEKISRVKTRVRDKQQARE